MMYVQRGAQGEVVGLIERADTSEEALSAEWAPADPADPEVGAFVRRFAGLGAANPLALTDAELARVTEDLIDVLIDRAVIQFTDLPLAAQNKLLQRRQTRVTLANRLNLLGGDEII